MKNTSFSGSSIKPPVAGSKLIAPAQAAKKQYFILVFHISYRKVSEMLEEEAKKMEEKLEMVKKMMDLEKDKRSQVKKNKDGTVWRSATTQK